MRTPLMRRNGFTLIEMAISLIVLGVVISAGVLPYRLYLKRTAIQTTQNNISQLTLAMGTFRQLNGYYPCAASLTLPRTNPGYGHQDTDCVTQTLPPSNCVGGMTAGGICIQKSARTFIYTPKTVPPTLPLPPEQPRVAVGAVPFRELNIDESQTFDGYGNRLFYAVTEREATPTFFQPDGGGIGVLNDQNASAIAVPDSAHFLIFSAGENGAGAYTRDGVLHNACLTAGAESLNCSLGAVAQYRNAQPSTKTGTTYFDDTVSYFTTADMPLWQYPPGNIVDIQDKPGGNVGTASSSQQSVDYKTQIQGVANVSGNVLSQRVCGSTGLDCFPTSLITAPTQAAGAAIQCSGLTPYLKAIVNGQPVCTDEVWVACKPSGTVATGVKADGTLQCIPYTAPPANCNTAIVKVCNPSDGLLTAATNNSSETLTAGTSRKATYTCKNGSWVLGTASGSCTCTPSVSVTSAACGTGFTGVVLTTKTTICPAGTVTVTTDKSACVCVGATKNNIANCPAPLTGTYTQTSTLTCPAGTFGAFLPASPPAGACTCTATTQTLPNNCPGNLDGTWNQTRQLTCPSGTFTAWTPTSPPNGACTCDPTKTINGVDACPPEAPVGSGTPWTQTLSCPDGTYGPKVYGTTDCQPAPPVVCHWNNVSSGTGGTVSRGSPVGGTCNCGDTGRCSLQLGTDSYENFNGCICQ